MISERVCILLYIECGMLCVQKDTLTSYMQMWLLEYIWLYCTWNWDSFLKCHEDIRKILFYSASHYFLKHYWHSGIAYFLMSLPAEIRTLYVLDSESSWFITVHSVNDSFPLCNVTFGSSAGFWMNWCSRHTFFIGWWLWCCSSVYTCMILYVLI